MIPFEYVRPDSISGAVSLLLEDPEGTSLIAGGTDILSEVKDGLKRPRRLVALDGLAELRSLDVGNGSTRLGAGLTLAELSTNPRLERGYPILTQAARSVATPQVRNVATLGGNLCQRPRCWYYRDRLFPCYKKGGSVCYGATGHNRYLAILGGGPSFMVHPSDMAPALIAVDARLEAFGPNGFRTMPLEDFFDHGQSRPLQEHVLGSGELVTAIFLPSPPPDTRSVYLKARERADHDFALASVAASITLAGGVVAKANVILGGVAPTPYRARLAEAAIVGRPVDKLDLQEAARLAVSEARPLEFNRYKVSLTANLVGQALQSLLTQLKGGTSHADRL